MVYPRLSVLFRVLSILLKAVLYEVYSQAVPWAPSPKGPSLAWTIAGYHPTPKSMASATVINMYMLVVTE